MALLVLCRINLCSACILYYWMIGLYTVCTGPWPVYMRQLIDALGEWGRDIFLSRVKFKGLSLLSFPAPVCLR